MNSPQKAPDGRTGDQMHLHLYLPPAYTTREPWAVAAGASSPRKASATAEQARQPLQYEDDEYLWDSEIDAEEEDYCPTASMIVNDSRFKMLVGFAILLSALVVASEIDYPELERLGIRETIDELIFVFFLVEIILRLASSRSRFFQGEDRGWNMFDLAIVIMAGADQSQRWLLKDDTPLAAYVNLLRMFRILRILRVLRLFRECDQLMLLAKGLSESMHMVFWIMVLMFVLMLICAIFLADMVGNQAFKFEHPDNIEEYWLGVGRCLITLFQFLTLDNWSDITREVTDTIWWLRSFFIGYIFITSFSMLSLLTGVIANHMTEVGLSQQKNVQDQQEHDLKIFVEGLERSFCQARTQGALNLDIHNFQLLMKDSELLKNLEKYNVTLLGRDVDDLFELLDSNNDGLISWAEFKAGIFRLRAVMPKAQEMLRLRYAVERVARHLEGGGGEEATVRKLGKVNDLLAVTDERLVLLEQQLRGFMKFSRATPKWRPSIMDVFAKSQSPTAGPPACDPGQATGGSGQRPRDAQRSPRSGDLKSQVKFCEEPDFHAE